jgi:Restriction endonuclease
MTMQYPLREKIGVPELLVGRVEEFAIFDKWLKGIPRTISQSRVILARRKSGKTAFVQRIFNQLWSENGQVIPFYFEIEEAPIWYHNFAIKYYRAFASHYLSFRERNPEWVRTPLSLENIRDYAVKHDLHVIVNDVDFILQNKDVPSPGLIWELAYTAPHRYASIYDIRFLVIIDEFQYIEQFIYTDPQLAGQPLKAMAGSFHSVSESKVAPMLVTGSYISILMEIMSKYLEAGRLRITRFRPYLTPEEGLLAVYKYAEVYRVPITNQSAQQINELCMSDPFFISQVMTNELSGKNLTTTEGVIRVVDYEISNRDSMMSKTWAEYIWLTMERVNGGQYTKHLMLFLNKHAEQYWTPRELKIAMKLELSEEEIYRRLVLLAESDVIDRGVSDLQFRGLQDGTLNLIVRNRFEQEIAGYEPNLKSEFQEQLQKLQADKVRLQGRNNYLEGMMAEHLLAIEFRTRKHFRLSAYFTGVRDDRLLNVIEVMERVPFQRPDSKGEEIDIIAKSDDGCVLMVEVRRRQERANLQTVQDLHDNALAYAQQFGLTVLPAFLSLGGFTKEAQTFCETNGIAVAETIAYAYQAPETKA